MPQDAFTLKYIARELAATFIGGKISKINQPSKDTLSLLIYTRFGTVKLTCDLSAKYCRLSVGETCPEVNPEVAPNFCMLLRKHLQNAEVLAVEQVELERVIRFDFKCFSEFEITEMSLYFEIMGKYSNAVLVKDGVIVGALKTASLETGARRVTLGGAKYLLPASQGKAEQNNLTEIKRVFDGCNGYVDGGAAKFIAEKIAGVAYTTAEDIVAKYGESVSAEQVYTYLNEGEVCPCVIYNNGAAIDFKARDSFGGVRCESLLSAQREYYDYAVYKKKFEDEKRKLNSALASAIKKVEKRLADLFDRLAECEKAEGVKLCGELITANIYAIQRGMKSFDAVNYYDENCSTVKIALDPQLSPSQNAQRYYKKYAKLKRTEQTLNTRKVDEVARLDYLKTIESNLSLAENLTDLKETRDELVTLSLLPPPPKLKGGKKGGAKSAESNYRQFEFGGFSVVCGRNNVQNDNLTKGLDSEDIWLHTKTYHSAHVGIVLQGAKPSDEVIKFAAEVCAYYSDARDNGKVPVDFTFKKYVKKPKGAALGYFEYTNQKTILVAPCAHLEERRDERR
ncbi:MAG: NFACT family protein [Candidatus Coproplasma sp.]